MNLQIVMSQIKWGDLPCFEPCTDDGKQGMMTDLGGAMKNIAYQSMWYIGSKQFRMYYSGYLQMCECSIGIYWSTGNIYFMAKPYKVKNRQTSVFGLKWV